MIIDVLKLRCPHCHQGSIAAGLYKTARNCPSCGALFEKEPGYFAGAIYPLYGISCIAGGLVALTLSLAFDASVLTAVACAAVLVLLLSPYFFWLSRCAFLHAEERFFKRMGA